MATESFPSTVIPSTVIQECDLFIEIAGFGSISPSAANACENLTVEAANRTTPPWIVEASNMLASHTGNLSIAQRTSSSVEAVVLSSQANTTELMAQTEDSVANTFESVDAHVEHDSAGDTLVRTTYSTDGSMSNEPGLVIP